MLRTSGVCEISGALGVGDWEDVGGGLDIEAGSEIGFCAGILVGICVGFVVGVEVWVG